MNKYLMIFCTALIISLAVSIMSCRNQAAEKNRYKGNQNALMKKARTYQTADSLNAISVERLLLTKRELEQERGYLMTTIKLLGVKPGRVQSTSTTATHTEYNIKPIIRDSIIYRDKKPDTIRCVNYQDKWLTFAGCNDTPLLIESRDTIVQVAHRVPYKIWFIRFGTKAIRQEALSRNPHSKIIFSEYIELTK